MPSSNAAPASTDTAREEVGYAPMRLLHAGVDTTVITLWMGHENVDTTKIYLKAALALKEQALNRTAPLQTTPVAANPPTQAQLGSYLGDRPPELTTISTASRLNSSENRGVQLHGYGLVFGADDRAVEDHEESAGGGGDGLDGPDLEEEE